MVISKAVRRSNRVTRKEIGFVLAAPGEPVILTDALEGQGAIDWSFEMFRSRYGHEQIEVQDHINTPSVVVPVKLSDYIDYVLDPEHSELSRIRCESRLYTYGLQPFDHHPELLDDVSDPYCITNWFHLLSPPLRLLLTSMEGSPVGRWLLIGPKGTVSTLHTDYTSAWLAQICGRKACYLVSPEHSDRLEDVELDLTSARDRARLAGVPIYEGVLEPGETLVMPHGWWHQVIALEPSITVSFNFLNEHNLDAFLCSLLEDVPLIEDAVRALPNSSGRLGLDWVDALVETRGQSSASAIARLSAKLSA